MSNLYTTREVKQKREAKLLEARANMGCASSSAVKDKRQLYSAEITIRAAVLIQKWYRRSLARLEARRRASWMIFTALEYASEQDELKLHNFFSDILSALSDENSDVRHLIAANDERKNRLEVEIDPRQYVVEKNYKGPVITLPVKKAHIDAMIEAFKQNKIIHINYVITILQEARKILQTLPNVVNLPTTVSKQVTICGDLHGKFDDLAIILYKNGYPSLNNPYIFNGDFVDRGPQSIEILVLLCALFVQNPLYVVLNRGNHEDHQMNLRYGFTKELAQKYKSTHKELIHSIENLYQWLPLATIVNNEIFVTHGGISNRVTLAALKSIPRNEFKSILNPSLCAKFSNDNCGSKIATVQDWKLILDILWSDPRSQNGCSPNEFRGGGSYFGPDITENFLKSNGFKLLVRSHECKCDGYEYTHANNVLTVFSASNYYAIGSNRGAYVKFHGVNLEPHFVQYMASKTHQNTTRRQRLDIVERSAVNNLRIKIATVQGELRDECKKFDTNSTGKISVHDWCNCIEKVTQLSLPWHALVNELVCLSDNRKFVLYDGNIQNSAENNFSNIDIVEILYEHKSGLEILFRYMDKDNSGLISMDEFIEACHVLGQCVQSPLSHPYIKRIAESIDFNKDGFIDFNELLEAFRLCIKYEE